MWTEAFLEYLTLERNYSLRTVEEYRDDLNAFESYYKKVDSTLSWETIDGDVVRDWMVSMMEAGRTATTVNRRLSALRTFYRYHEATNQRYHQLHLHPTTYGTFLHR